VAAADEKPEPLTPETVSLEAVDKAAFDKIVAKHEGKVVLVDFWATWCAPCVKQFPHSVELAEKLREKGLVVVSVSFDGDEASDTVRKFLADKNARLVNLVVKGDAQEALETFDVDNGAIPAYWVFDRAGKLARRFSPSDPTVKFKVADLDAAIDELLAQPARQGK
jgi:thiol-disulfide isomerase/thioredoxin